MRLAAGRWAAFRERDRGAGNEPCPNLHAPPPFFLLFSPLPASRQEPVLPAAQSLSDMHTPAPSLLPPCSPAGGCFAWGAGLPPAPAASSLPCLHSGGLVQACLRRGTDLSSSSLFLPLSGAGADARHIPYLPFFLPLLPSLAGPLAEPAPCR